MARRKNKGNIPKFFGLPQSSKISFKVPKKTSNNQPANSEYPYDIIGRRGDYEDKFLLEESTENRPRIYSPEQTYNYKSAWKRYQKGLDLVQREEVLKDPEDSDKYKCVSPKAPKGYWEVMKKDGGVCLSDNVFVVSSGAATTYDLGTTSRPTISTPVDPAQSLIDAKNFEDAYLVSSAFTGDTQADSKTATIARNANRTIISGSVVSDNDNGFGWRLRATATIHVRGANATKARLKVRINYQCDGAFTTSLTGVTGTITSGEYEIDSNTFAGPTNIEFVLAPAGGIVEADINAAIEFEILECYLLDAEPNYPVFQVVGVNNATITQSNNYDDSTQIATSVINISESFPSTGGVTRTFLGIASPFLSGDDVSVEVAGVAICPDTSGNFAFIQSTIGTDFKEEGYPFTNQGGQQIADIDFEHLFNPPASSSLQFQVRILFNPKDSEPPASYQIQITVKVKLEKGIGDTCIYRGDDGSGGGDGEWECNCPDSSKKKDPNPNSIAPSNEAAEDWTDSDAGAQNGECKHIWAVRILRGEVPISEIPKDMPISEIFPGDKNGGKNGASGQPRVIGGKGGVGFDNWNPNQRRKTDA